MLALILTKREHVTIIESFEPCKQFERIIS